jgi:transcriptional regulator CtsR
MTNSRKWFLGLASGLLVATIAFGGISLATVSSAQAAEGVTTQHRGGPGIPGEPDGRLFPGSNIDYDALLADALGISVDELEAARQKANQAAIDLAVEEGLLTEDEAALMHVRLLVKDLIDTQALNAEALDMSMEELQAALDDGQTMQDLLTEKELTPAAYREAYQAAYENAIQALVDQGVITAEQAELLLDQPLLSGLRGAFTDMDGSFRDKGFRAP